MSDISLCMIVKNEEKVLSRCLESVKDAVDEIIIVDTGSTDKTKKIALDYTEKVYDFEWIDDFSAARNYSFSKATKDYILWLDADDIITAENSAKLIELKENLNNTDAVMMKYNTAFDEDGKPTFSFYRERLIKRTAPHSWKGKVHEVIVYSGTTIYSDIAVDHKSVKKIYSTRNLDIYEKHLSSEEKLNSRDKFYFGRELYYHKKYNRAIEILTDFLEDSTGWIENKIEACRILSYCCSETENTDKALRVLFSSFIYDLPRAEICCDIGNLFMKSENYSNAIYWFETALNMSPKQDNGSFIDLDAYGYLPCIQLCVCYDKLKNHTKAEKYNNEAGKFRPNSPSYLQNLKYFEALHKNSIF